MKNLSPNSEPVVWTHLAGVILGLAVSFGLTLTAEQVAGVMAVVQVVAALVARRQVTPTP